MGLAPWDGGIAWSIRRWIGLGARRHGHLSNSSLQASCQLLSGTIPELNQGVKDMPANRAASTAPKLDASAKAE
jgi:hypothetical protein